MYTGYRSRTACRQTSAPLRQRCPPSECRWPRQKCRSHGVSHATMNRYSCRRFSTVLFLQVSEHTQAGHGKKGCSSQKGGQQRLTRGTNSCSKIVCLARTHPVRQLDPRQSLLCTRTPRPRSTGRRLPSDRAATSLHKHERREAGIIMKGQGWCQNTAEICPSAPIARVLAFRTPRGGKKKRVAKKSRLYDAPSYRSPHV